MKQIRSYDFYAGAILIALFVSLFVIGMINIVSSLPIQFDGAWNATVATNLFRHGEYRVSYPQPLPFYFKISTGLPVLLPASWLMSWLGVNNISINLIVIIYASLAIVLFWILLSLCYPKSCQYRWTLSAILTLLLILSDCVFNILGCNLFGEAACMTFTLIAMIACLKYHETHKDGLLFISGTMIALSFLTKVATIFILVTCVGILIIETFITKRISRKALAWSVGGFITGFALADGLKFYSLGGMSEYLHWWKIEWEDMIYQSNGYSNPSIVQKYTYLEKIFGCKPYFGLIIIGVAVLVFLYGLWSHWKSKKISSGLLTMGYCGLCGASLLVYYLPFGKQGIMKVKRLAVNEIFIKLCIIFLIGMLIIYCINQFKKMKFSKGRKIYNHKGIWGSLATLFLVLILFPAQLIHKNLNALLVSGEPTYYLKVMQQFLGEVDKLPQDATIYTAGWWQEPNVTLFLDKEMTDLSKPENLKPKSDHDYFIVGHAYTLYSMDDINGILDAELVRHDSIKVNYDSVWLLCDRGDFDLFAIYKINYKNQE